MQQYNYTRQSKLGEAATMEAPPPLLDDSSDESSDAAWIESENSDEGSDSDESSSCSGSDVPGSPAWWLSLAAELELEPETCTTEWRAGSNSAGGGNGLVHAEEAASFVLARMKQTQSGLQVRDVLLSCLLDCTFCTWYR